MKARVKYLTITESREIEQVCQLGQMTMRGGNHVLKFQPMRSREDSKICPSAPKGQKFDHLEITQNCTGTTIRPNDEDGKRLRAKISTGDLLGGQGNLRTRAHELNI